MIYTKKIGDRQVFSDCRTIQANDGSWISNPTEQQIADAGWVPYIPPVVPPAPSLTPSDDEMLQAVKRLLASSVAELSDEEALAVAALYPTWASEIGALVNEGERLWYNEKLYKVIQAHIVQEDWTPDTAPSLFVEVSIEEWPEWKQPTGTADAYNKGDKVTYKGDHYISLIDANTWSPEEYPAGWEKQ